MDDFFSSAQTNLPQYDQLMFSLAFQQLAWLNKYNSKSLRHLVAEIGIA